MPYYKAIQREVRITSGFVPKTCEIAHVFELLGKELHVASNRIDPRVRKYPGPVKKQGTIIAAIRKLEQHEPRNLRSS
jgi:hypothetical protein